MPSTPRIACLGWGSLVWDPRSLPLESGWFRDGPLLPIEFARESSDGRITLVIAEVPNDVQALWAVLASADLEAAIRALAHREDMQGTLIQRIGFWTAEAGSAHEETTVIGRWATGVGLDGVVWTALKPGFRGDRGLVPSEAEVLRYLRELPDGRRKAAELYVRNAPLQIVTPYRKRIEEEFGWLPSQVAAS